MGPGHLAVGLAAKRVAPNVHLGVLLLATEVLDILCFGFIFAGIERFSTDPALVSIPWSHGLFMSAVWSVLAALLAARIFRNNRTGAIIGLVVFSHWVLDFISHPMGIGQPLPPDLPLLFEGSPKVGLGLYNYSLAVAIATDFGLLILGAAIYLRARKKKNQDLRQLPA